MTALLCLLLGHRWVRKTDNSWVEMSVSWWECKYCGARKHAQKA